MFGMGHGMASAGWRFWHLVKEVCAKISSCTIFDCFGGISRPSMILVLLHR